MLAVAGVCASAAGWRSALVALGCMACCGSPHPRRFGLRVGPIVGSLVTVLLLLPFAPQAVAEVAVRGFAASLTLVLVASSSTWPTMVAELQTLGLPPIAVAFLALLSRDIEVLAEEAQRALAVLKVRGAFDRRANLARAVTVLLSRLLVVAWFRADQAADAMALRGFVGRLPANGAWRLRLCEARQYGLTAVMVAATAWGLAR